MSGGDRVGIDYAPPHPGQAQGSKDSVTLLAPTIPFLGHHRAVRELPEQVGLHSAPTKTEFVLPRAEEG